MNHITCDNAFDMLTAPGQPADPELTAHLQTCSRCRIMAETLAPALNLFRAAEPSPNTPSPNTAAADSLDATSLPPARVRKNGRQPASVASRRKANQAMAGNAARRLAGLAPQTACPQKQPPSGKGRGSWLAYWGGAAALLACALVSLNPSRNDTLPSAELRTCPRHSETTTEWMKQHQIPVNQACLACHPPNRQSSARLLMIQPQPPAFLLSSLPCYAAY